MKKNFSTFRGLSEISPRLVEYLPGILDLSDGRGVGPRCPSQLEHLGRLQSARSSLTAKISAKILSKIPKRWKNSWLADFSQISRSQRNYSWCRTVQTAADTIHTGRIVVQSPGTPSFCQYPDDQKNKIFGEIFFGDFFLFFGLKWTFRGAEWGDARLGKTS